MKVIQAKADFRKIRHVKITCRCSEVFIGEVPAEAHEFHVILTCPNAKCGREYRMHEHRLFTPEGKELGLVEKMSVPMQTNLVQ